MIAIRNYKISDIERFTTRNKDQFPGGIYATIDGLAANSITWSILNDGIVVGFLGLQILWSGVANVWAITSDAARGHGIGMFKAARKGLVGFANHYRIRRYNTIMKPDDENLRWIKLLGFEYEYTMEKAGPDHEDLFGYVKWVGV